MRAIMVKDGFGSYYAKDVVEQFPMLSEVIRHNQNMLADWIGTDLEISPMQYGVWMVPILCDMILSEDNIKKRRVGGVTIFAGSDSESELAIDRFKELVVTMGLYSNNPVANAFVLKKNRGLIGGGFSPYMKDDDAGVSELGGLFQGLFQEMSCELADKYAFRVLDKVASLYYPGVTPTYVFVKKDAMA